MTSVAKLLQPTGVRQRLVTAHAGHTPIPALDVTRITDKKVRKRAVRLLHARDAVLAGEPMRACAAIAGLHQRWFERVLVRYLSTSEDGSIVGERAFLRDYRVKRHPTRTKPMEPGTPVTWGSSSGLFLKLVTDNKDFREDLVSSLRRKGKKALQPNKIVGRELRKLLERLYIAHGIGADEYPRNTRDLGLRACRRWMVNDFLSEYAQDWISNEHGPDAAKAATTPVLKSAVPVNDYAAYQDWMLDEVRIDCRTSVEIINAQGDVDIVEQSCFHIIRVIELGYNTTLATWPVFSGKASAYDVGNLLWRALSGWTIPSVLPDLNVDPGGGFPAMELPELRWKAPRCIHLDNALSHLSAVLGVIVQNVLGAEMRLGSPGTPKARPEIEAKFSLAARRLVHQLPGTTGTGPKDPQRKRHEGLPPERLVRADALEQALTVMAANENGAASTAAHGIPALERLRRAVVRNAIHAPTVALHYQTRHMFFPAKPVTVRVDLASGRKPHVNFMRVRYSSAELQRRYDLNGKKVLARFDPDDLRILVLFGLDGAEICRAHGEGRWGLLPHDVRMRQMALRNIDRAAEGRMPQDGPLEALLASLERDATSSPSAASRLGHCLAVIGRHIQSIANTTAAWFAQLAAGGNSLDAAALCRTAANNASKENPSEIAPPPQPEASPAAPPPSAMQPRNAIRRLA